MSYKVDTQARPRLIAALTQAGGSASVKAMALVLDKSSAAVLQLCYALAADGVVRAERAGPSLVWHLTGTPLPEKFRSTGKDCQRQLRALGFDHRGLSAALGFPDAAPCGLPAPTIVHYVGDAHVD